MTKKFLISFIAALMLSLVGYVWSVSPASGHGNTSDETVIGFCRAGKRIGSDNSVYAGETQNQGAWVIQQAAYKLGQYGSAIFAAHTPPPVQELALKLFGPGEVDLTKEIDLAGVLKDVSTGSGVPDMNISFSTGGFYLGQTRTDSVGAFSMKIAKNLRAGKYLITAYFNGAHLLSPASNTILIEVLPAKVWVQTVPAVAGISFRMAGQQFTTGSDGSASVDILQAGQYELDILTEKFTDPSVRIEFGRWAIDSYQTSREVNVPGDGLIQVGLNVSHRVSFKFVDLDGYPVDPSRISSISIRSVQGDIFNLKPGDTPWLPFSRTARHQSGLDETDLLYSVDSVVIDGSNVVNSAQQRFFAKVDDTWTITLLLYALNINARDGLFASPIGKSVDITFPNGQVKNYALNQSGNLEIHALARGIYHVSLIGVNGLGTSTPVALSRNQDVKLNIVTRLDMGVSGGVALGFALGMVLYGRPRIIKNLFRRKSSSTSKLEWT